MEKPKTKSPLKTLLLRFYQNRLLFLAAALVILVCDMALARAGGGGGFSGGGGGGGGGGGSGDGGGGIIIYLLIRLVFEYPLIGIPVVAAVLYFMYLSSKQGASAHVSRSIRRGNAITRSMRVQQEIARIQKRDPAFTGEAFIERCGKLLPAIQSAWSAQDMTPTRHFISDGVFERFSLQIEIQRGSGIRNQMSAVRVLSASLIDAESDSLFDTLHLAITAEAVDQTIALESGRRLQGGTAAESFTEIWSFLRRPGAQTLARPGLLEGWCPNCGTQLQVSMSTTCHACLALINSGEYDWVLSEITQQEVWSPSQAKHIPGLAEMRQRDPGFNRQAIEDRASAIFWHHRAAEFFGQESYLSAVALPEFIARESRAWQPDEKGRRRFYADAAVGQVDLAEVIPGEAEAELDRVRVFIKWSAHRELEKIPALLPPAWERSRFIAQDYALVRKRGVQSVGRAALNSLHCPGCGAPQVAKSNGSCRYCGLRQNDGSVAWVLESVSATRGFAQAPITPLPGADAAGLPSPREREMLIQSMAAIMLADGVIDPKEETQLRKMAAKHQIDSTRLAALIHEVQSAGQIHLPAVDDWTQRNDFLRVLVQMCLADGNVSSAERGTLKSMVTHLGYSDIDIDTMIAKERAQLYAASRATIKANRKK
ncbi:MAG: TIM44-like domain-containing protein [Kiritimatiellae bacterium]|nr:TIM44-like domain-containing protein [Kiritimatiellia bacterium]